MDYSNNSKRVLHIAIVFYIFFPNSYALSIPEVTIDNLFQRSQVVAFVEIYGASLTGKVDDPNKCGSNYKAQIIIGFKGGKNKRIKFQSMDNLVIGGKYLLFLNEKFLEAEMRYLSMGNNDRLSYEICSKNKSKLFASSFYGEIFKFSELLEVTENQKWLINKTNYVLFSKNINTKTLNFKSNDVSEDFLNYISFELIDWNDLSAHLIKLSRKYDHNDR